MTRLGSSLRSLLEEPETRRKIGPFQLIKQLGRGGSAPVWLGREVYGETELRLAAVKLFALDAEPQSGGSYTRAGRDRIAREARTLCQLEHPNIVRFFSIAVDESAGLLGVAMEYLTGTPLDAKLTREGARPLDETLQVGISIASALSAVHRAGLLHRDIKPANIVDAGGSYKLIDFGISSPVDDERRPAPKAVLVDDLPLELEAEDRAKVGGVTIERAPPQSGSFYPTGGTVGYLDPHCLTTGASPTAASDLYALGVVMFECLTGKHPAAFAAAEGGGLKTAVLDGSVPAPSLVGFASDLPPALPRLIDVLLSARPEARPRSAELVAVELERIRDEVEGKKRQLPPEEIGPFRGLARFEREDEGVYFGRSSEVAAALELLRSHGAVALVGPSGSGKSSLARAGIVPRLSEGTLGRWPQIWDVALTEPGRDARQSMTNALRSLDVAPVHGRVEPDEVVGALRERVEQTERGLVLVVDQLEELVTQSDPESRAWAARLIGELGRAPIPGLRVLVTVRRDLLDPLLGLGDLGKVLVRGSLLVEPMTDRAWSDVVVQALEAYGYELEDDALHDELSSELAGTSSAMPLVAFALSQLWAGRDQATKRITREGFRAIGGLAGALERHADTTVARLVAESPSYHEVLRQTLLSLTTAGGTRATRRTSELGLAEHPLSSRVLEELERARLIVREGDTVTLAHEALLTHWAQLRSWVHAVRDDRMLVDELTSEAKRYRLAPDDVPLLKRRRLAMALDLRARGHVPLGEAAYSYVEASRRAARRARWMLAAASIAILATTAVVGTGYVEAIQDRERAALEKASVEEQKAKLEQQRRQELEDNQAELTERQTRISKLMSDLNNAQGENDRLKLQALLEEEEAKAKHTITRIQTSLVSAAPPPPPPTEPPPTAPTKLKIQK